MVFTIRVVVPLALPAGTKVIPVFSDDRIEVSSKVSRRATRTSSDPDCASTHNKLNELSNERRACFKRDARGGLVCARCVCQPVYKLPRFLGVVLHVAADGLIG